MSKQVKSLVVISQERLARHIDAVTDVGDVPYYLLKDALKLATPKHLDRIEKINPFLIAESDELWKRHCMGYSDLREAHRRGELQDPLSWRALYIKRYEENEEKKRVASEKMRNQYKKIQNEKAARSIKELHRIVPPGRTYEAARRSGSSKLFRETLKATERATAMYRVPRRPITTQPIRPTCSTNITEIRKRPSALTSAYQSYRARYPPPARSPSPPLIPPPPRLTAPCSAEKHVPLVNTGFKAPSQPIATHGPPKPNPPKLYIGRTPTTASRQKNLPPAAAKQRPVQKDRRPPFKKDPI